MTTNRMVAIFSGADLFIDTDMGKGLEEPWNDAAKRMSTGRVSGNKQISDVIRDMAALGKENLGELVTEKMCDRAQHCRPVSRDYIKQCWVDNDICFLFFVIAYSKIGANFKPIGFVLCDAKTKKKQTGAIRPQAEQNLLIEAIAADKKYKIGSKMLEYVTDWGRKHLHMSAFSLHALPHVLTYYPKVGFQHRDSCYENAFIEELPQELSDFNRTHPKLPTLTDSDPIFVRSDPNYAEYEPYRKHIMNLHGLGFTANRNGICADPSLTLDELVAGGCADDGFKMRKCTSTFEDPEGPLPRDPPSERRATAARIVKQAAAGPGLASKGRGKSVGHVPVMPQHKPRVGKGSKPGKPGAGKGRKPGKPRVGKPVII